MFIQVIQGAVSDAEGLQRELDRWLAELAPGASGWLGSTGGTTADGHAILIARFESEAAARANSDRPEQGEWWAGAAACFAGEPEFCEGSDVDTLRDGGSDDAGFVQVMQGRCSKRAELKALEEAVEPMLLEIHTGLMGGTRLWHGDGEFVEANYFVDEAAARAGEQAMGSNPELLEQLGQWQGMFDSVQYLDLSEPKLASP